MGLLRYARSMEPANNFLPITVVAAIALFVFRELLEGWRRWRSDLRKKKALRSLLARECELNLWTLKCLHTAVRGARDAYRANPPEPFRIERQVASYDRWRHNWPDGGVRRGGSLPPVRKSSLEASAFPLAELDTQLFAFLQEALDAVAELEHIRGSLVDLVESDELRDFPESFTGYAFAQMHIVYAGLNELYLACTGRQLKSAKMR